MPFDSRSTRRLEQSLFPISEQIAKLRQVHSPCTGIGFVTFNEQRAAHACLQELRTNPTREIAGETVTLSADFAPHPDNILWENLQVGWLEAFLRGTLVNVISLLICTGSTISIMLVTQFKVAEKQQLALETQYRGQHI